MDISEAVRTYLTKEAISQAELAKRVGISQTAISRALRHKPQRQGKAHAQLVVYMQQHGHPATPDDALSAVNQVWDGSAAHATALAKLVFASEELWPKLRGA